MKHMQIGTGSACVIYYAIRHVKILNIIRNNVLALHSFSGLCLEDSEFVGSKYTTIPGKL